MKKEDTGTVPVSGCHDDRGTVPLSGGSSCKSQVIVVVLQSEDYLSQRAVAAV